MGLLDPPPFPLSDNAKKLFGKNSPAPSPEDQGAMQGTIGVLQPIGNLQSQTNSLDLRASALEANIPVVAQKIDSLEEDTSDLQGNVGFLGIRVDSIGQSQSNGHIGYLTRDLLYSDLTRGPNTLAEVTNDLSTGNIGLYIKLGASGTGSWQKSENGIYNQVYSLLTQLDTSEQISGSSAILIDKSKEKVLMWSSGKYINFFPGATVTNSIMDSVGIDNSQQTASYYALYKTTNDKVPLWLEGSALGFSKLAPGAISYLNATLNLGTRIITEWDVYLVAGQSNALGLSNDSSGWINATDCGLKFDYNGVLSALVDPVGNNAPAGRNSTGSAWPAFAKAYYAATGRGIIIVPTAYNGTNSTEWRADSATIKAGDTESLWATSVTRLTAALSAIQSSGRTYTLRGVLYFQGESDSATPGSIYKDNIANTLAGWRTSFGDDFQMILGVISHIGTASTYAVIRAAQREFALSTAHVFLGVEATQVYSRGLIRDGTHYTQPGYNFIGASMGRAAATSPRIQLSNIYT